MQDFETVEGSEHSHELGVSQRGEGTAVGVGNVISQSQSLQEEKEMLSI